MLLWGRRTTTILTLTRPPQGKTYYFNQTTGQTVWDKPTQDEATFTPQSALTLSRAVLCSACTTIDFLSLVVCCEKVCPCLSSYGCDAQVAKTEVAPPAPPPAPLPIVPVAAEQRGCCGVQM